MGLTRVTAERYALSTHPASFTHQTAHLKREISRQVVSVFAQDEVLFAVPDIGAALLLVLLETVSHPWVTVLSFLKNGGTQFGALSRITEQPLVGYFVTHFRIFWTYGSLRRAQLHMSKRLIDTAASSDGSPGSFHGAPRTSLTSTSICTASTSSRFVL